MRMCLNFVVFLAGTTIHVITSHLGQTESAFPALHLVSYVLNDLGSSCDFPSGGEVSRPCCMFGGASTNQPTVDDKLCCIVEIV